MNSSFDGRPGEGKGPCEGREVPPQAETAAALLYEEAKSLMDKGRYREACPRLVKSDGLDPEVGTKVNLGRCYESLGATAHAWEAWRRAEAAAAQQLACEREPQARTLQERRLDYAHARLQALASQLLYLTLRVPARPGPRPEIRIDGEFVPEAQWQGPIPVDPGSHELLAAAPGRRTWHMQFEVDEHNVPSITITLPALEPSGEVAPRPERRPSDGAWATATAIAFGATSVATAAIGIGFGLDAFSAHNTAQANCTVTWNCNATGIRALSRVDSDAAVSNVAFGLTAAEVVAGLVFFWIGRGAAGGVTLRPQIDATSASVRMAGEW